MTEDIIACYSCSFKCVKSQLYKTKGKCPKCDTLISKSIATDTA